MKQIAQEEAERNMAEYEAHEHSPLTAVERFAGVDPTTTFSPLVATAICFVPILILILTLWDHLGAFQTVLFRDYMPLVVCCLLAWAAAYLPVLILNFVVHDQAWLWWAGGAYFAALAALAARTLIGTSYSRAACASGIAWLAGAGGLWMYGLLGNVTAYLASPFLLYYLYMGFGSQFSGIGSGLRTRQRFKRQLEIATLNPRDADAHCQLGLIYLQRRQYEQAAASFRKALEADPSEADGYYQLGRIARIEGRYAEAIPYFEAAAVLDDKHSSSEIWRELGAAKLLSGDAAGALAPLERYCERREYDPEGAVWRGRALAKLGRSKEARAAFEQAIESVRTMPSARRRQVASWEGEARKELKKLAA